MAHAALTHQSRPFLPGAHVPLARLPVLTQLADFQRALNEQFDSCRHGARYRPGLALRRLRSGVELLCRVQEELLHPALSASRLEAWPELGLAMASVEALRDLASLDAVRGDAEQLALVALLEGLVQLQFVSLDELLAQTDATPMPWQALALETETALQHWQAGRRDVEELYALN